MSLTAHLTAGPAEHGRLAFHPDCPRCRAERLAGKIGTDSLASRRAQAALAAGLLAFSAGATPAAAQAPGVDPPQQETPAPGVEPPGLSPDFDPGGEDAFDYETAPVPGGRDAGGEEDEGTGAPVETEPLTDLEAPPVGEDTPEPPAPPQPVPAPEPRPAPAPPPPAASPVPAQPSSPPATPVSPAPAPPQQGELIERPEGAAAGGHLRQIRIGVERQPPDAPASTQMVPAAPVPVEAGEPTPAASFNAAAVPVARSGGDSAASVSQPSGPAPREIEGDAYTVRAGDSLWSIARRLLGPEASAGRIAREVNRLWELNRDRIGTGNPSLINVGTVIEL
jgi:LysM domain